MPKYQDWKSVQRCAWSIWKLCIVPNWYAKCKNVQIFALWKNLHIVKFCTFFALHHFCIASFCTLHNFALCVTLHIAYSALCIICTLQYFCTLHNFTFPSVGELMNMRNGYFSSFNESVTVSQSRWSVEEMVVHLKTQNYQHFIGHLDHHPFMIVIMTRSHSF